MARRRNFAAGLVAIEGISIRKESKDTASRRAGHWLQFFPDQCSRNECSSDGRLYGKSGAGGARGKTEMW